MRPAKRRRKSLRGPGFDWSEAELAALERLRREGATRAEIAAALPGRTSNAIRCKLNRESIVVQPHAKPSVMTARHRKGDAA